MSKRLSGVEQRNRAVRQEQLREQLSGQKHVEKVVDNIKEMENLDFQLGEGEDINYKEMQACKFRMDALKTANEQRLKLINKFLPDLRSTEVTGDAGGDIIIKVAEFKSAD